MKKPSEEAIRAEAEMYAEKHGFRVPYDGSNNFYDDIDVRASFEGFIEGAKRAISQMEQDDVIEKVKAELEIMIKECQEQADSFFERGMTISESCSLAMKVAYQNAIDVINNNLTQ